MNALIETLNLWGDRFASFALPMLIQSSLLIAVLFLIDLAIRRRVRSVVRYGLGLLLLIKLALPPSLALPTGIGYWLSPKRQTQSPKIDFRPAVVRISDAPMAIPQSIGRSSRPETTRIHYPAILILLWLTGGAVLLAFVAYRTQKVRRDIAIAREASDEQRKLLDECRRQIGLRGSVDLRVSRESISPAVCGLWKPVILIPGHLLGRLSNPQLRGVLLHELAHIKRNDVWLNHAQTLLQIFYWWHPLLWPANAHIRRVREQAVDEMVMITLAGDAEIYPTTLLEVARFAFAPSAHGLGLIGIVESRSALKERIGRLLNHTVPKSPGLGLAGGLAIALAAALLLPMAQGQTRRVRSMAAAPAAANDQTTIVNLEVKFVELPDSELQTLNLGEPLTTTDTGQLAWELTSDQVRNLVQRLEERGDVTLLAAPRATTRSGGQASIEVVDVAAIGDANARTNIPQWKSYCQLAPSVNGDRIELTVTTRVTETGTVVSNPSGNLELRAVQPDESVKPDAGDGPVYAVNAIGYINYDAGPAKVSVADGGGIVLQNPVVKNWRGNTFLAIVSPKIDRSSPGDAQINPVKSVSEKTESVVQTDQTAHPSVQEQPDPVAAVTGSQTPPGKNEKPARLVVTVAKQEPYLYLDSRPLTLERLREVFKSGIAANPEVMLSIRADAEAPFGQIIKVMDAAKAAGIRVVNASPPEEREHAAADTVRETRQLVTRTFKVNPATFGEALRKQLPTMTETNVQQMARAYFKAAGFPSESPAMIFYNNRTGLLLVRAVEEDLNLVQTSLNLLMPPTAQLVVETRFLEIPIAEARKLGLNLPTDGTSNTWSRVLSAQEARNLLRTAEQLDGIDILSAPKVTTLSGRQAQIQVVEEKTIVTGINPQALTAPGVQSSNGRAPATLLTSLVQIGPTLDIVPAVGTDGRTIQLEATPSITEFLGYDASPDGGMKVWVDGKEVRTTVPLPRLRTRRMEINASVLDGQTLVVGNPVQSITSTNPDGESQTVTGPEDSAKRLLVLITPTLIDPAGNPIHPLDKGSMTADKTPSALKK